MMNKYLNLLFIWTLVCLSACNQKPKDIRLKFNPTGTISVIGLDANMVSKIGPMSSTVVDFVQQPARGVTRLIVKNTMLPDDKSINIFDIRMNTTLDIKGNGNYRLTKRPNSNIWYLAINGRDVQSLSIIEGPPSKDASYAAWGTILMIFGVILLFIGIPTIPAFGSGCIISIIAIIMIYYGYILTLPA